MLVLEKFLLAAVNSRRPGPPYTTDRPPASTTMEVAADGKRNTRLDCRMKLMTNADDVDDQAHDYVAAEAAAGCFPHCPPANSLVVRCSEVPHKINERWRIR